MVHKQELHELTMTRTLRKASGLFELIDLYLSGMLANIHEYFDFINFLLTNLSEILHVAILLPVGIVAVHFKILW